MIMATFDMLFDMPNNHPSILEYFNPWDLSVVPTGF